MTVSTVTDKERVIRRSYGSGFYIEVDILDSYGDRRRLKVSERGYGVMKVGDRVLAIRYNDGNYGFYDWFDIVKCKE